MLHKPGSIARKFTNRQEFLDYCQQHGLQIIETTFGAYGMEGERAVAWLYEQFLSRLYTKEQFVPAFDSLGIFQQYCAAHGLEIHPNGAGLVGRRGTQAIAFYQEDTYVPVPEPPRAFGSKKTRRKPVENKGHGFHEILSGNAS